MSSFGIRRLIGVPSVCPSKTPDRILTVSDSLRCVTIALCPGARRSRSGWMSASESESRGGHPSITAPIAPPCDSPHVVTRKSRPQLLPTRRGYRAGRSLAHFPLHQEPAQDLARWGLRNLVDELEVADPLVRRDPSRDECHDRVGRRGARLIVGLQHDERLRDFTGFLVR